jgi:serine/threonine-protein kinase
MLGKLLDRRYEVTQVLGAGGFGRTYLAQDTRRPGNPTCVVKQLKPISNDPNFLETARRLFNSEAETLEQLGNHDQIPRLLAYFEEDQEFYLVQEFIGGHTLTQELQPGQRWEERQVIGLLQEVLSILDFVHHHGVIHRDIKPDNLIRRDSDQKLVLVDFGAVKQIRTQFAATQGRASNTVAVGTPGYMASEQALGQPRPSSDIYALGIIGIQALTGLMPISFQEDLSTGEILWQHLVSVSRGFAEVLTKMVRYHFKDRYQSAAEALQALEQLNRPNPNFRATSRTPGIQDPIASAQRTPPPPPAASLSERQTLAASPAAPTRPPVYTPPATSGARSDKLPLLIGLSLAVAVGGAAMALSLNSRGFSSLFSSDGVQVADTSQGTCTVISQGLNVRSSPNGSIVDTVKKGTNLTLTGAEKNGWLEINSPLQGWVFKRNDLVKCTLPRQKSVESAQVSPKPNESIATLPPIETPNNSKPVIEVPKPKPPVTPPPPVDQSPDRLAEAADKYNSGDLNGAIADARKILPGSEAYEEAQANIKKWQEDWTAAKTKYDELQTALDEGDWQKVIKAINPSLLEQSYWRTKFQQLMEEAKKQAQAEAQRQKDKLIPPDVPVPPKPQTEVPPSDRLSPNSGGETQGNPNQ